MIARLVGLVVVVVLASGPAHAQKPKDRLAELLEVYKSHDLPLPPPKARFVKYDQNGLGFELKPATKTEPALLLTFGGEYPAEGRPTLVELSPDIANVKDFEFDPETCLGLALQCKHRGWDKLAEHFLERSKAESKPEKQIANIAWGHWSGQVTHPTRDRAPVAKRLKSLLKDHPELAPVGTQRIIECLDLALVPSKSKPGSVEALIDGLVDQADNHGGGSSSYFPGGAYRAIVDRGFEAVPALIEHLGDKRLTRSMMFGFNNFGSWNMCVQHLVGDLLAGLSAEELDRGEGGESVGGGWLRRQQAWPVRKEAAKQWWEKAAKVGEERYAVEHVLPKRGRHDRTLYPNEHLLRLLEIKYPKRLPEIYRTNLEKRPDVQSWAVAESIQQSKLPDAEKVSLAVLGAKHSDWDHRNMAFHLLAELDKKQFDGLLVVAIDSLPKDVSVEYWLCSERIAVSLTVLSDEPKVWAAMEKAIARSSVGLRMTYLDQLSYHKLPRKAERLRLIAKFLDNPEVRDRSSDKRFNGPGAGSGHEMITVRDFVAESIAYILGKKFKEPTNAEEWAKLRSDVRQWLKAEGISTGK